MTKPLRKTNPIFKIMNSTLIDLPSPSNISYWWNIGSLLGICLLLQVFTGIILSFHYTPDTNSSFSTMSHITRDVNIMWLIRMLHANGASLFFLLIYIHIARGIFFTSYINHHMWYTGVFLVLMLMGTAFMGYVLPWGQMSFWAATVITNLLSAVPYIGHTMVYWMWGGFSVDNPTLTRFFSFHFILPFIIMLFSVIHIMFLHMTGSSNPLGLSNNIDKSPFHPYFTTKDIIGLMVSITIFTTITLNNPFLLGDPENYIPANPMVTPVHIQPEWYFLFAYAILRSIPNKLGGVIALLLSILILLKLPYSNHIYKTNNISSINKLILWTFISVFLILTWLGSQPIEYPLNSLSQIFSVMYFLFFMMYPMK